MFQRDSLQVRSYVVTSGLLSYSTLIATVFTNMESLEINLSLPVVGAFTMINFMGSSTLQTIVWYYLHKF